MRKHNLLSGAFVGLLALGWCLNAAADNVLQNPGFEIESPTPGKPEYWSWTNTGSGNIWRTDDFAHSGDWSVLFPGWSEWNTLVQTHENEFLGGQVVTASVWGLTMGFTNEGVGGVLILGETDTPEVFAEEMFVTHATPSGVWVQATIITNLPEFVTSIDFILQVQGWVEGLVYFDDAYLDVTIPEPAVAAVALAGVLLLRHARS